MDQMQRDKKVVTIPDEYKPAIDELPGDLSRIAREIDRHRPGEGVDLTLFLAQVFHGQPVYFRNIMPILRKIRNDAIRREYDAGDCTMLDLASRWGLSHVRIKQILAETGKTHDSRQQRLF